MQSRGFKFYEANTDKLLKGSDNNRIEVLKATFKEFYEANLHYIDQCSQLKSVEDAEQSKRST